ncbi:MAG: hypothetical protein J6R68_01770, partial [Clostridia bacterium]|nr:hypothetical protein [Clostridia bacterium]
MKNKKLLSLILCFIFVFTSLLSCLPAGSVFAQTVALTDEDYNNSLNVLKEIFPAIPLAEGETITRAEFVAAVSMLLGKDETTGVATGFADVAADHKYSGNIKFA